ncbi:hypothetical protein MKY59_21610 [Paenibacillus sp. FSL W8-0426]|uniref:hypothetical protein n=1 Tax=Paenibacillus sp. FSL W8-0426 TaxID=2921714 RepID=UPI0030DC69A9
MTQQLANQIAQEFTVFLNEWHSAPEEYDDPLDAQIHRWYADILTDRERKLWPPRNMPYFSPSAADADPRALYEKTRGTKKESRVVQPNQGRQTRIGTAIGDVIQRDLLFAERHYEKAYGRRPRFTFERNDHGEPMFEDFAKRSHVVTHNGKTFALYGTGDGIMRYVSEDGEVLRVGLEVKSKQTTYAKTSPYSMRNGPEEKHVKQCVCYSIMYDVDYYVILYVNGARKEWSISAEDYEKNPDIMAFGVYFTDEMREEVLDYFTTILDAVESGVPPLTDLDKWTFNDYKRTIALSLTGDEMDALRRKVAAIQRSGLPDWKKRGPAEALAEIERIRAEENAKGAA